MKELIAMVFRVSRKQVIGQVLMRFISGSLPALTALVWNDILTQTQTGSSEQSVLILFVSLAIVGGVSVSHVYFTEIADTLLRNSISRGLQKLVHQKAGELPMRDYESSDLIDTLNRASTVFCYGDAVGFMVKALGTVQSTVAIASMAAVLWNLQPQLVSVAFILVLPGLVKVWLNRRSIKLELQLSPKRREANLFRDYLSSRNSAKEMRSMDASGFFLQEWREKTAEIAREERNANGGITIVRIAADIISHGATLCAYLLCIHSAMVGQLEAAGLGALIVLIGQFLQNTNSFMESLSSMHHYALSIDSAIQYFHLPSEVREKELNGSPQSIQLRDVSYAYPGGTRNAVAQMNLTLNNGEILAVVGVNGSGKSTFSKLVLGLIDPTDGLITMDGTPPSEYSYESLYRRSSAVFQDYVRYAMNLRDNVVISDERAQPNDREIYQLLDSLGLRFIGEDADVDLNTELGVEFGGRDLSGGEWQQIAIARAAFRDADVVVLDEPSSAIDPLRESEMYNTFQNLCRNRIGIIITHRLSMCAVADKILVMDAGNMAEYGTHAELMGRGGMYAYMYKTQQELHGDPTEADENSLKS